ncbi:MAG: DNA mismatch repair protein MutS, partial [bacterium]|nr:DNA mismatch repair protein MutS [bacterium]
MAEKLTPMMQQYFEVKRGLPANTLLLFRLGDFYEMFFEDAEIGARLLGITLTKRQATPMAGIPHHAADNYVSKLLAAGKKVAICDQAETAQAGKLVKRALTRILSPGTTLSANQLDAAKNHYLCALELNKAGLHAAGLDLSTGEFRVASDTQLGNLLPVLTALDPAELVLIEGDLAKWQAAPHEQHEVHALHQFCAPRLCSELPGYHFEISSG